MKSNWIRNKFCKIDGVEHTISHRMVRDAFNSAKFETKIIENHPTNPIIKCSFESENSLEMYSQTNIKLAELSKKNFEIGDSIC